MPTSELHQPVLRWYAESARSLPWRQPGTTPWAVLVSEVMLQQTPVSRVLPVYEAWLHRWPAPSALAADSRGNAVRLWGRLGYPRRALRLHEAATEMALHHDGHVPASYADLRSLPGIGDYTAAAVVAFAYGKRAAPLDTNIRRVLSRVLRGSAEPSPTPRAAERRAAKDLLPEDDSTSATWNAAVMELGAIVCRARSPRCGECPVRDACRWRLAGYPGAPASPVAGAEAPRRAQTYTGTDRHCRGVLLAVARASAGPVPVASLAAVWRADQQRERALASLISDGLLTRTASGDLTLP